MSARRRILVLQHEGERGPGAVPYRIWHLVDLWRAAGIEVLVQRGIESAPEADLVVPHLDVTIVPADYVAFLAAYPCVLNRAATDLSKRVISRQLVAPGDGYDGPVIVKTDRNYGGLPELRLGGGRPESRGLRRFFARRTPLASATWLSPRAYPVFDAVADVPAGVFENEALVVERFLPERDGELYAIRTWVFLGRRESAMRRQGTTRLVKPSMEHPPDPIEVPDDVRSARQRLGLDYGKIDFVLHAGTPHVLDATRTPGLRPGPLSEAHRRVLEDLAHGIDAWLHEPA